MSQTDGAAAGAGPRIQYDLEALHIEYERLFSIGAEHENRCFARRVLAFAGVQSVSIDPHCHTAVIGYRITASQLQEFITSLAAAIGGSGTEMEDTRLPQWSAGEAVTLHRFGDLVSKWKIISASSGHLQLRHPALIHDANLARRAENVLRTVSGVTEVATTTSTPNLWIRFKSELVGPKELVRIAESQLALPMKAHPVPDPQPVDFRTANATVGVATVGELVLPLAEVLGAGLLVVTQAGTLRDAALQLRQGKLGTPVWLAVLLACSIASGQVLAFALTDWSFRYWTWRWRRDLANESRVLLEENAPMPSHARIQAEPKIEVWTPVEQLRPGQMLGVQTSDIIAVDGRVLAGVALVHEAPVSGVHAPVTKKTGDEVLAGSTIIQGNLAIEALRVGQDTRIARIARSLLETTTSMPYHPGMKRQVEVLVDRTVSPTLAAAGVGLAVGDLFTAGAILHQDWLSGADLAIPLESLRDIRLAARRGAVIRDPTALARLAVSRFIVLDDGPALHTRSLELHQVQTRLPESDTNSILRYVAGAGLYLGDERALALAMACRKRNLVVRQPSLIDLQPDHVTVRQGTHTITLRSWPDTSGEIVPPLTVEIDGAEIASLRFKYHARPQAAYCILALRKQGFQVFLASNRSEGETEKTAGLLGIDLYSGELSDERRVRLLQSLRRRGIRATFVGGLSARPEVAQEAHVSISLGGAGLLRDDSADIVLLGEQIDPIPEIALLARGNPSRVNGTCRRAMIPNLLCVAGGFGGVLTGITAGVLANLAVLGVYRQAMRSLHSLNEGRDMTRIRL